MLQLLALAIAMAALGTAGGLTTRSAFAQSGFESEIGGGCEDDECELGGACVDNPNGHTKCSMSGSTCKTLGC